MCVCDLLSAKASYDAIAARCPTLRCRGCAAIGAPLGFVGWRLEEVRVGLRCMSCGRNGKHRREEMKIDIDKLSEAELADLNNRIIARLRFLREERTNRCSSSVSVTTCPFSLKDARC
jgi:hypothetical protein